MSRSSYPPKPADLPLDQAVSLVCKAGEIILGETLSPADHAEARRRVSAYFGRNEPIKVRGAGRLDWREGNRQ